MSVYMTLKRQGKSMLEFLPSKLLQFLAPISEENNASKSGFFKVQLNQLPVYGGGEVSNEPSFAYLPCSSKDGWLSIAGMKPVN